MREIGCFGKFDIAVYLFLCSLRIRVYTNQTTARRSGNCPGHDHQEMTPMANENVATIQKKGERFYLKGLPFEQKDRAKSLGCKWDSTLRAWWTADLAVAEEVAGAKFEAKSDSNRNCVVDLSRVTNWGSAWELIYPALPQVIVDERAAAQRFERADARWKAANEIVATLHRAGLTGALLAEAQAVEERFRAEMQERDEKWRAAQRAVAAEVA